MDEEKNVEKNRRLERSMINMKILMLTWEYPPRIVGGIARVVYDLSHRLIKDGHEVTVVTYKDANIPNLADFENDKGVKVYRVDNYMITPNNFTDWIMQLNFNLIAKATEIINEEGTFDVIQPSKMYKDVELIGLE